MGGRHYLSCWVSYVFPIRAYIDSKELFNLFPDGSART